MSAFASMAQVLESRPTPSRASLVRGNGSMTDTLIAAIEDGPKTSEQLRVLGGHDSIKKVWGLLANDYRRGRLKCDDGIWSINKAHTAEVDEAITFLQGEGYVVRRRGQKESV